MLNYKLLMKHLKLIKQKIKLNQKQIDKLIERKLIQNNNNHHCNNNNQKLKKLKKLHKKERNKKNNKKRNLLNQIIV